MIRRAPQPPSRFVRIRNEVIRDERLSYRARGLLGAMLSYPDDWKFNREWLAKQSPREGVDAIRSALKELDSAGYLVRRRVRLPGGKFGWEHVLFDTPQAVAGAGGTTGGSATDGSATGGGPTGGFPPSKEGLSRTTVDERTELNWPTAGAAGAHEIDPSLIPTIAGPRDDAQPTFTDWSPDDFELFVSILGGMNMCSDGSVWRPEGEHPLGTWYWAFRRRAGNPMRWPGRYFERIRDNEGIDGYLLSQGLVVTV